MYIGLHVKCRLLLADCNEIGIFSRYCHLWPIPLYNIFFPHYLIKGRIFEKNVTEHKMCVLIFCTTFVWNISHFKKNWARYDQKCISVCMKVLVIVGRFYWILNFLNRISKDNQMSNFMKFSTSGSPVVSCGQTDMTKPIVAFRNLASRPKIIIFLKTSVINRNFVIFF